MLLDHVIIITTLETLAGRIPFPGPDPDRSEFLELVAVVLVAAADVKLGSTAHWLAFDDPVAVLAESEYFR